MEYKSILLSFVICAFGVHYLFRHFSIFKRYGIVHIPLIPLLGSAMSVIFRRMSFIDFIRKMYNFNPDAKYFGLHAITTPVLLLRDPELIRSVLVQNFATFPDRFGFDLNEPLLANLLAFSLRGQKWRDVRDLLSFSFTSSKMKIMFALMSECAVDFANFLSTFISAEKSDMDMKDAFAKYAIDIIATCAFGIKIDSMKNPTNKSFCLRQGGD